MIPAREHFKAIEAPAAEADQRLKIWDELARLQGGFKIDVTK
jgi:hypothetical protein